MLDEEANPWKILDTRDIYQNPWIKVREDKVIRPDGEQGIYGVVETKIATGVIALDDDDNIVLVGQYRYPIEKYSWEIVEGGGEKGESPLETIKRELAEEAGLVAEYWQPLGHELFLSNCFSNEIAYLYLAKGLSPVASNPDGTEVLKVKKVPFKEALQMVMSGEISDAMSVMAILFLNNLRSEQSIK